MFMEADFVNVWYLKILFLKCMEDLNTNYIYFLTLHGHPSLHNGSFRILTILPRSFVAQLTSWLFLWAQCQISNKSYMYQQIVIKVRLIFFNVSWCFHLNEETNICLFHFIRVYHVYVLQFWSSEPDFFSESAHSNNIKTFIFTTILFLF